MNLSINIQKNYFDAPLRIQNSLSAATCTENSPNPKTIF